MDTRLHEWRFASFAKFDEIWNNLLRVPGKEPLNVRTAEHNPVMVGGI
jgi:hypothetical protein